MDDDDPVVEEAPVFLSQALAQNLHLYQYPIRPGDRDWSGVKVIKASLKPKNGIVRLETALDIYSDKYCTSKGEQIAINTDGAEESSWHTKDKEREKSLYFKKGVMDKIVLESSIPCNSTHRFAIGIYQDKELHCTALKGIVQLRPSYSYYDKQDKNKREKHSDDKSDDEEKEPEAQQVTVKFARQETDVAKKAREKSYESVSQRVASEPWYDGFWKNSHSDYADLERLKLFSASTSAGSALSLSSTEYVRFLVPPPEGDDDVAPLSRPSLEDQVKEILINAKLMTFNDLRSLVRTTSGAVTSSALLSALSAVGCCIRGLWTIQSPALYTRKGPVPARLMCAARDHVLYLFTKQSFIDRRKVTAALPLPPLEVLEVIQSVAKLNSKTGWELLIPPDTAFEAKYPDLMKRQNMYWDGREKQFTEMIAMDIAPKRQRKKSQRDSISEAMFSPKSRCNSVSEEESDRKKKNKMAKRTRHSSSSAQDAT